ncbi:hypothetical protein AVEN_60535-1 [Araneus ventricosus]|uniref:Uncharacterized protein n=1 Tax=Araneus ventricosus TaxID=182803 RepID=A0A4Y2TYR9_ARAVE|nr:hypothetical protein AVEN_60535-1 [Araneus ventricosus]
MHSLLSFSRRLPNSVLRRSHLGSFRARRGRSFSSTLKRRVRPGNRVNSDSFKVHNVHGKQSLCNCQDQIIDPGVNDVGGTRSQHVSVVQIFILGSTRLRRILLGFACKCLS